MAESKRSEDVYGEKLDRCIFNGLVKLAGGIGAGIVFSVLLTKRKPWPLILGAGFGAGMALSDCNHEFQSGVQQPSPLKQLVKNAKESIPLSVRSELLADNAPGDHLPASPSEIMLGTVSMTSGLDNSDKMTCCEGKAEHSCLCKVKEKAEKSPKVIMNKPFPCLSDSYEKKNMEE